MGIEEFHGCTQSLQIQPLLIHLFVYFCLRWSRPSLFTCEWTNRKVEKMKNIWRGTALFLILGEFQSFLFCLKYLLSARQRMGWGASGDGEAERVSSVFTSWEWNSTLSSIHSKSWWPWWPDSANFFHFPPKFRLRTRKPSRLHCTNASPSVCRLCCLTAAHRTFFQTSQCFAL